MKNDYSIEAIGFAQTPFTEKFGIPRQPRLATYNSQIVLQGEYNQAEMLLDINQHSHIWVLFMFHQNLDKGWKATVRPPRLGGNAKTGVLATRSTFRPNGIGMSAVKLIGVKQIDGKSVIEVEGLDLVDGTPIIDIKPYIPYSDCIADAHSEMAQDAPEISTMVSFSDAAKSKLANFDAIYPNLSLLITQVLEQDPRPSYKKNKVDDKIYGIKLYDVNIRWQHKNNVIEVIDLEKEEAKC